jgi:hypothetical protein
MISQVLYKDLQKSLQVFDRKYDLREFRRRIIWPVVRPDPLAVQKPKFSLDYSEVILDVCNPVEVCRIQHVSMLPCFVNLIRQIESDGVGSYSLDFVSDDGNHLLAEVDDFGPENRDCEVQTFPYVQYAPPFLGVVHLSIEIYLCHRGLVSNRCWQECERRRNDGCHQCLPLLQLRKIDRSPETEPYAENRGEHQSRDCEKVIALFHRRKMPSRAPVVEGCAA